jgi:hypothetical protein
MRPVIALIHGVLGTSGKAACPLRTCPVAVRVAVNPLAKTLISDLLITSEKYGGAGHCSGLLWLAESSYLSRIFFTGLHTIAEHCALGDVEVM